MSAQLVLHQIENGVLTLQFNDPEHRNAMSDEMAAEFSSVVKSYLDRDEYFCVLLRGAGKAFSAGGHLDMLQRKTTQSPAQNRSEMLAFYRHFLSILEFETPVIAALNGHAVGAGCCVALGADIRIAHEKAKLGLNFAKLGLHPGMGATYFLPRLVGPAVARELLFTGRIFTAQEALQKGVVNSVASNEEFDSAVSSLVAELRSSGPETLRELKRSLRWSMEQPLAECLEREAEVQTRSYASAEFAEGLAAAKEKRPPHF